MFSQCRLLFAYSLLLFCSIGSSHTTYLQSIKNIEHYYAQEKTNIFQKALEQYRHRYHEILVLYYKHSIGDYQFFHSSGCQWEPRGKPYTMEEAQAETRSELKLLFKKIEDALIACPECTELFQLKDLIKQKIKDL